MKCDRRQFLTGAASLAACYGLNPYLGLSQAQKKTRIILLGTKGGPRVGEDRSNPSTLLLINDIPYLVDCGYGTTRQLIKAGVAVDKVRYIFITHHHSDHNLEYGVIANNAWATGAPMQIDGYGPPGLEKMARDFFEYLRFDIETRMEDEGRPDLRKLVHSHEFDKGGVVLQNEDAKVSACLVRHPQIKQAYAYRFDTRDRSVVISGDTAYSPELADFARGADVLIHEVMYVPAIEALLKRVPTARRLRAHLMASHSTPEEAGRIASQAAVKTLVLSHFVPGDDPSITGGQWSEGARKHFRGRIIVGKDLMEI